MSAPVLSFLPPVQGPHNEPVFSGFKEGKGRGVPNMMALGAGLLGKLPGESEILHQSW